MKKSYVKSLMAMMLALVMAAACFACAPAAPSNTDKPAAPGGDAPAPAPAGGTIKIGTALPMTGSVALNGEMILEGIQYAVDQVNAAGGINGKQVELVSQDDQGEPNQAANVANLFTSDASILAVIGNLKSSCTLAAAPIYEEAGLVTLSPDSSSPKVTDAGEYIFRVKNSDVVLARTAAKAAVDDGNTKIAIIYENNDFGMGVLEQAKIQLAEMGGEVVMEESILTGEQTDFSASIGNLKGSGAQAVLFGCDYNEAGLLMKQMKDAGLDLPRYGTDGLFTDALIQVGGDAANGTNALTSFHESDPNETVQSFITEYKAAFGVNPSIFQAEGYDAAMIVMEAIKNAGEDRTAIRDYMSTMKYQGVIGDCSFDENGDVNIPLMRVRVVDGAFELILD